MTVYSNSTYRQAFAIVFCFSAIAIASHPNWVSGAESFQDSPFGEHVWVFDPSMEVEFMQNRLDALHEAQARNQFGEERYALLFKPGRYPLDVTLDYYTQASGLGKVPGDVLIEGAVQSTTTTRHNNVTLMFWRSAENFEVRPSNTSEPVYWAVSQAAPYRRMHIRGDLKFDKGGWASGGFLANSIVEGTAGTKTGQQWFNRNCKLGSWKGGNWNVTFVGVDGAPEENWSDDRYTVIDATPIIREKPFLMLNSNGNFAVFVPELRREVSGVSWEKGEERGAVLDMDQFHIAFPDKDDAASLNLALQSGKHLLFTPGIYRLQSTLQVTRANTILFGLGLATLIPMTGEAAIEVEDVDGVQLVSLVFDAGPLKSETLIRMGPENASADHLKNPSFLYDVFCRVGGNAPGAAESCLIINSNHVVADHLWLWRADHGAGATWQGNPSDHGLLVNGNDVIIYGLFNEHFQKHQTLWKGERGRVYFYQSEIPYDPPSIAEWNHDGKAGYASYKVTDCVQKHEAYGLGIYSFFRPKTETAKHVRLENSVECPDKEGILFKHITNFAGRAGGINHVINGLGDPIYVGERTYFEAFVGGNGN